MKLLLIALLTISSNFAFAASIDSTTLDNVTTQNSSPQHDGNVWNFLGCTHDEYECHHLVHDYGYNSSYATHDQYRCHHGDQTHACYGR